jgi:uncharacterized protein YndB with AHSA1/START domain
MLGSDQTASSDDHFTISRVFDAPRELVWQAWTAPERIVAWFGPKGLPPARVIRHELREGGVFLSATKMPDGSEMCGKFVYREVAPISRLVWVHSFADVNGVLVRHPMSPSWPLELLTTVTFADLGGSKTEVTLDWVPLNANELERKTFNDGKLGMQAGWTGSFDQLAEYIAKG